jgi:hypothetical protein
VGKVVVTAAMDDDGGGRLTAGDVEHMVEAIERVLMDLNLDRREHRVYGLSKR